MDKRLWIFFIMVAITIASAICMPSVTINDDLTEYLPSDSNMSQGLEIMESEFSEAAQSYSAKLMFEGITEEQREKIKDELSVYEAVEEVQSDGSRYYNKDGFTLFELTLDCSDNEDAEKLINSITEKYADDYTVYSYNPAAEDSVLDYLIPIALAIVVVVLVLMCSSYFEPVLLMVNIAVAVLINMGTNIIFPSVSDMTFSIAAVLQLILSLDYSIILIHRYMQEKELSPTGDKIEAMRNTIKNAFTSVFSSSLTTIFGLLALLLLSFTIGRDMGLVLAKGVLLSLITSFTVLPTLIIWSDGLLTKTNKAYLRNRRAAKKETAVFVKAADAVGRFSYHFRKAILIAFAVLFVFAAFLQNQAEISFSNNTSTNEVLKVFPDNDTIVLVVNNKDTGKVDSLIEWLQADEKVLSVQSYNNTLGIEMTSGEIAETAGIDESFINTLFYIYENGMSTEKLTLVQFMNFISTDAFLSNPMFGNMIDEATKESLKQYAAVINGIAQETAYDADAMSAVFGVPAGQVQSIYQMNGVSQMTIENFTDTMIASAEMQGGSATEEMAAMKNLCVMIKTDAEYSPDELIDVFPIQSPMFTEDTVSLLYLMYYGNTREMQEVKIPLYDFFLFLSEDIVTDPKFSSFMEDDTLSKLGETKAAMEDGKAQLVGENYSRIIVTTTYLPDTEESDAFYTDLDGKLQSDFSEQVYMVGEGAMGYEISQTFHSEYLLIAVVTAAVIFLIICLSFRKLLIPALLVCVVECAVFVTMSVMAITNVPMYFIAVIIVQCILMGSMVDYGILMTSYYREVRQTVPKENALPETIKQAVKAILTSGLVMTIATAILGAAMSGAIGSILRTLSVGILTALLLILSVLPSMLSVFDRFIIKKLAAL